jgi:methionyl-tRNA formyltransferase
MNTQATIQAGKPSFPPQLQIYSPEPRPPKFKVAVFGSFYGGYTVLKELLYGELAPSIQVTGVATDDPTQPFTHPNVRLWKYPHSREDELLVSRFAAEQGLPVYTGRVKSDPFFAQFFEDWKPDLCLMATFGQKIPPPLFNFPKLGFYNFHHSDMVWPSYPGPDPIAHMVADGKKQLVLTLHEVNEVWDGGRFVAHSHAVPIPPNVNAIAMHKITWPQMGPFIRCQVKAILEGVSVLLH